MKTKSYIFLIIIFTTFSSCFLESVPPTKLDLLSHIRLCDNSYIGLLNFCNFTGKVENNNTCKVCNIELRGTFYNEDTKQTSVYTFKLNVPITAYGSATYSEKTFVGKHVSIRKVEIINVEKGY